MHIICTRENLSNGVSVVGNIAGKNTTLPILNNILLTASERELTISATNLEVGIQARVRGKIDQTGSIAVPARLLHDYLTLLDDDRVELKTHDNVLSIISGKHEAHIKTMPPDEYPIIPQINAQAFSIAVPAHEMVLLFEKCFFAASRDSLRPELNGVFVTIRDGVLLLAATDSFRLSEVKYQIPDNTPLPYQSHSIIPLRVIQELLRITPLISDHEITLSIDENQVGFTTSSFSIVSRLISAQYPDYQQIIPTQTSVSIVFECAELEKAIKITSLFSKTGVNDIEFDFIAQKGGVVLRTVNSQIGENTSFVPMKINGTGVDQIIFNWRFLLEGINALSVTTAQFKINSSDTPVVLMPLYEDKKKDSKITHLYLIMPIKQ